MKVSIITTSFNSDKTIKDTLQSVKSQSYSKIEHIIVDGYSSDKTLQIISKFSHVTKTLSEPDKGIYDAMNKGIEMANGDIIGILNSDDVYANHEVIHDVVRKIDSEKSDGLYGNLVYVKQNDLNKIRRTWIAGKNSKSKWLYGWMPPHPTFFVKKSVYQEYGLFDTSFTSSADYELMLRFIFKHKIKVSYLNQRLVKMRMGGQSTASLTNRLIANKEDNIAWEKNNIKPYFFTTKIKPLRKIAQFLNL